MLQFKYLRTLVLAGRFIGHVAEAAIHGVCPCIHSGRSFRHLQGRHLFKTHLHFSPKVQFERLDCTCQNELEIVQNALPTEQSNEKRALCCRIRIADATPTDYHLIRIVACVRSGACKQNKAAFFFPIKPAAYVRPISGAHIIVTLQTYVNRQSAL